jgi:hypothetical protein
MRVYTKFSLQLLAVVIMLSIGLQSAQPAQARATSSNDPATTWYVATTGYDGNTCLTPATPCLTINGAIIKASAGDFIRVAGGVYASGNENEVVLINKSIGLSGGWNATFMEQSEVSVIDGQDVRRGINVDTLINVSVTIENFTVQNGYHAFQGGGILNTGALTLNNSVITGNASKWMGGGIFNKSTLVINNTTIDGNVAGMEGSGGGGGGGIESEGNLTLNNSVVSNNILIGGFEGSGLNLSAATAIINNSTISANSGGDGSGIYTFVATVTFNNSTITNNQSYGFYNVAGQITLKNTLISGNASGGSGWDCFNDNNYPNGTILSQGYNLIGNGTICAFSPIQGDQVGTDVNPIDPLLGPLQDNGGPTLTQALLPHSPAIDAGSPLTPGTPDSNACPATDQRGVSRPQSTACDIGAYEQEPTFADVPFDYWAWQYVESISSAGITSGCGGGNYCPAQSVTRGQMAVFLLKGMYGKDYTPPDATGNVFNDIPADHMFAKWIEQLNAEGITGGCGGGSYCPNAPVTREQMAVFLLVAKYGSDHTPPPATGVFLDVPAANGFAPWIEQLAAEGITGGCGGGKFCPKQAVTRAQMAVFLQIAFSLTLP